jgi:hypothetical protein
MMGMQNQNSASAGQVYYDNITGQYYTNNQPQQSNSPLAQLFSQSPELAAMMRGNRNYIGGSPLNNTYNPLQANTMQSNEIAPYPTTESLFPGLNAGLTQNMQGTTYGMPSSGAGRFLTSGLISNNTSKGQ